MIDTESSLLVQEYYKHTTYHHAMADAHYIYTIGNTICGDSITVYICIQNAKIVAYSYDGSPALITQAAAAFVGDYVIGEDIYTILTRDADRVANEGFTVSYRRRRSTVSALLAVRNCIHQHLGDGIVDEYDDIVA